MINREVFDNLSPYDKVKYLKESNIEIYSISKLNTLEECYHEYWLTYIKKKPGIDNVYGFLGSKVHSILENKVNGQEIDFAKQLEEDFAEAEFLGFNFPTEQIGDKWKKDMLSFANTYQTPIYKKYETEKLFLFELDNKFVQGIIDLLIYNDDGTVSIVDYKTSGKFANKDLVIKGRQLILYGLAMEQLGYKVKDLAWNMLKYVKINYRLKNGKTRETIAERGFIVEKLQNDIKKELANLGYDEFDIDSLILTGIESNDLSVFPKSIQDKYTIEDYIVYYDFSDKNKIELRTFIEVKIDEVEQLKDKEEYWEPIEINKWNEFYCNNLCSRKNYCEAWLKYKENQDRLLEEEFNDFLLS